MPPTLFLDIETPNHDGPDGSFTRLLHVPITPLFRTRVTRCIAGAEAAMKTTHHVTGLTFEDAPGTLLRPARAQTDQQHEVLDEVTARVHATGILPLEVDPFTRANLAHLADPRADIEGMRLTSRQHAGRTTWFLAWFGNFTTRHGSVLLWKTTPIDLHRDLPRPKRRASLQGATPWTT